MHLFDILFNKKTLVNNKAKPYMHYNVALIMFTNFTLVISLSLPSWLARMYLNIKNIATALEVLRLCKRHSYQQCIRVLKTKYINTSLEFLSLIFSNRNIMNQMLYNKLIYMVNSIHVNTSHLIKRF